MELLFFLKEMYYKDIKKFGVSTDVQSLFYSHVKLSQFESIYLSELYRSHKKYLKMHFNEFRLFMYPRYKKNNYRREKLTRTKYLKKRHHKKKVLNEEEIRKREWRKKVKYKDDRSKRNQFSYDELEQDYNNKLYRKWVKSRIKSYDYELVKGWKKYSSFFVDWRY